MSVDQAKAREVSLWVLYGFDVGDVGSATDLGGWYDTLHDLDAEVAELWPAVEERVQGVWNDRAEIDRVIQQASPRWKLDRMGIIDRNLLRLGVWEIFNRDITPVIVIDACVDLGKKYGEKRTHAFVNGLLDQICRDHDIAVTG